MENKENIHYIKHYLKEYDFIVHIWIYTPLTKVELDVFELILKGYNITSIARHRIRSTKTVSSQKHQVYKKLGIRSDITFWIDIILSSRIKIVFCRDGKIIDTENELLRII
ncbi:helix-turn-helix domain-containing protein [Escherichia coli]|uniref:helix-turn-helix domain-containing protein n=1 Tax=Escherichia coli TaxID=562 RepID=UPI00162507BC|nr:helix-turn-helix transcriptional regulator [Escherichia coli]